MAILELKKVCKKYEKFSLKDVSFNVEPGSITGFIGRNGAGKTTTLKGIMNLVHFDSGEVDVFGHPFSEKELDNRQYMSFSLSELNFFSTTRLAKLTDVTKRFYKEWSDETYGKLCERFALDQNKRVQELSSGMKVKYNLAVALSHNAKLLLFDEPTSGLDPISRDEVLDIFSSLIKNGERSILFSTHITSDLDKCADHIVYIKSGEILASETKSDFIGAYKLIKGKTEILEGIKNKVVSYKKNDEGFSALVKSEILQTLKGDFSVETPDLETVMVYNERRAEDEEFII